MFDKFTFGSAGEIQEVEFALARGGFTHPLLKQATGGDFFGLIREVLEGRAEICRIERLAAGGAVGAVAVQHIIDCDTKPFEPSGLTVAPVADQLSGRVRGRFVFDPARVRLHWSPNQQDGKHIEGIKLKVELANEPVLPANVLDFYLANPHLIPEEWKDKAVFFWGTTYCDSRGRLCVRYLYFNDDRWCSGCSRLGLDWGGSSPAAVRAN